VGIVDASFGEVDCQPVPLLTRSASPGEIIAATVAPATSTEPRWPRSCTRWLPVLRSFSTA
jgi:hypothetical protein